MNSGLVTEMGSSGDGDGSCGIVKYSAMWRNAKYPARIVIAACGSVFVLTHDINNAAPSSTTPDIVTHDRSGLGERKNASAGNDVCVSSSSTNHFSQLTQVSCSRSNPLI